MVTQVEAPIESQLRKRSVNAVEIADEQGRRRTIQLEDLSDADRELAEKFGYKPVSETQSGLDVVEYPLTDASLGF